MQKQLDWVYNKEFVVPNDDMIHKHVDSYAISQEDAKMTFNSYMSNFLTLNRDLRTDKYGIVTLLDNVSSSFSLLNAKDECYYAFELNYDLNPKGTIRVLFESSKPVQVYISD